MLPSLLLTVTVDPARWMLQNPRDCKDIRRFGGTPCTAVSRASARCTYNDERVRARDSPGNEWRRIRPLRYGGQSCNVADHAKTARDLQPSTYGNRREKLSRVGAIGAWGSRASAFDRLLARASTRRTDYAFERVWWTLTFRAVAANRVRTRPIKLNVPAARLTLKNGISRRAPS